MLVCICKDCICPRKWGGGTSRFPLGFLTERPRGSTGTYASAPSPGSGSVRVSKLEYVSIGGDDCVSPVRGLLTSVRLVRRVETPRLPLLAARVLGSGQRRTS